MQSVMRNDAVPFGKRIKTFLLCMRLVVKMLLSGSEGLDCGVYQLTLHGQQHIWKAFF